MTGIQFVTDEKRRRVAVQIDLKNTVPYGRIFLTASFLNRAAKKRVSLTSNTAPTA